MDTHYLDNPMSAGTWLLELPATASGDLDRTPARTRHGQAPKRIPLVSSGELHLQRVFKSAEGLAATDSTLDSERFEVKLTWETPRGLFGGGQAKWLPGDQGSQWFFADPNVELVIKALMAHDPMREPRFSVYTHRFLNVDVELTIKDRTSGEVRVYTNLPIGSPVAYAAAPMTAGVAHGAHC